LKLGTVLFEGNERVVVETEEGRAALVPHEVAASIIDLIRSWPEGRERLKRAAQVEPSFVMGDLTWLPPVPAPGKVVCVALNNSANKTRIMSGPSHPATFIKPASSLIGHGAPIKLRAEYGRVHPEPELAVIIGRTASGVSAEDAMGHVFGYTILNDLTSPTMRAEDTFHYRAIHPRSDGTEGIEYVDSWVSYPGRYKGADTFGPIGPWIATLDELADPHDLAITCSHQGRVVTKDNTGNLTNQTADVIAFVSSYQSLYPGDVLALGTALQADSVQGGAIQNIDLNKLGGPIEVTISGIGALSNPVVHL